MGSLFENERNQEPEWISPLIDQDAHHAIHRLEEYDGKYWKLAGGRENMLCLEYFLRIGGMRHENRRN